MEMRQRFVVADLRSRCTTGLRARLVLLGGWEVEVRLPFMDFWHLPLWSLRRFCDAWEEEVVDSTLGWMERQHTLYDFEMRYPTKDRE